MTTLDFLKNQVIETRSFTKRLILEMPEDLWFTIPENTDSNFAWQIGHILLAQNYHIISCAFGRDKAVFDRIPIQSWANLFGGIGSPNRSVQSDLVKIPELRDNFEFIFELCVEKLESANEEILTASLEPTPFKNPIAKTKYDAISWSFKHEMWHCAEMEHIKIKLGKQFKWIN